MKSPQVSVIIVVKDGEKYLARSIESVLAQSYQNYELLIV
ncbi:MAG: glycosyltransferase family 2 protein, partial [Okeania sp. SIO2D1]|nr:glycosyltransferase family 2 protein [Okeania sp. SIO2D1]